jgi:ribose/xylose/arabinose/galactoside ABC-type transport system permease subunit
MRGSDNSQIFLVLGLLVVLFLAMVILTGGALLSPNNLSGMAFQLPLLALLSLAQMGPLLTGGPDLSIASIASLGGVIAAMIVTNVAGWSGVLLAIGAGVGVGLVVGMLNAFFIAIVWVPSIIATLGTMILLQGVALVLTKGSTIAGFSDSFLFIGQGTVLGIPMPFIIFLAALVFMILLLERTRFGVKIYMLGSNMTATKFSGIDTRSVIFRTFVLSGLFSGIASLVMITRFNAAQADYGESYLLLTVLACVLGGVSPAGGVGKAIGIFLAVAVLQVISTSFNLLGLSSHLASAIWGVILVAVIMTNRAVFERS